MIINNIAILSRLSYTHNLEQLIVRSTRITEESSTTIDLLFANNNHRIVDSGVLHVHLSDHSLIYCIIKASVPRAPGKTIEYRSYKHYSKELFLSDLKEAHWDLINKEEDVNVAVEMWNEMFTEIADQHAPIKNSRVKAIQTPWLTSDLRNAMQERDYYHRKAINGVPHTEPQSIVEILNDHFSNIGTKLAAKLNIGSFLLYPRSSSVQTTKVKNEFTLQLETNKAISLDGISARMLKDSAKVLAPVLQL